MPSVYFPESENIYKRRITLTYGPLSEINRVLRHAAPSPSDHTELLPGVGGNYRVYAHHGHHYDYISILRYRRKGFRNSEIACLSHEVLHHTIYTLCRAGILMSEAHEECYTYYHEWLFKKCLDTFWS